MEPRQPLNDEQRRLLKFTARMPLASVANLAAMLDLTEDRVRRMLATLRANVWVESVVQVMNERRQHRWFLSRKAVDGLYVTDHHPPAARRQSVHSNWCEKEKTRRQPCPSNCSAPKTTAQSPNILSFTESTLTPLALSFS